LDMFLYSCHVDWMDEVAPEMPWELHAREAVEYALENAEWDENDRVIRFRDRDEPRMEQIVANREELVNFLENLASSESANYAPWDDSEPVFSANAEAIVDDALAKYEERMEEFFGDESEEEEARDETPNP